MRYVKHVIKSVPLLRITVSRMNKFLEKNSLKRIDTKPIEKSFSIITDYSQPLYSSFYEDLEEFRCMSSRFNRVVIWGLRNRFHTHRYIHKHFSDTLEKLNSKFIWLDDAPENSQLLAKNDFVFAVNQACEHLPLRKDIHYCLHNLENLKANDLNAVYLQVYTNQIPNEAEVWNSCTLFLREQKMLFQPWGTDLLPHEFHPPVFDSSFRRVHWIGSIVANDALNQGNEPEITALKRALKKHRLSFEHLEKISIEENIAKVRSSRIAPAISGRWQVEVDYLPCRVFKNVSYGMPAITNVRKFQSLFGPHHLSAVNIDELVDAALSLSKSRWLEMTHEQQKIVASNHTYLHKLNNIFKAYDAIYR